MNEFKRWLQNVKFYTKEDTENIENILTLEEFKELEKEFKDWYNNYTPKIIPNDC